MRNWRRCSVLHFLSRMLLYAGKLSFNFYVDVDLKQCLKKLMFWRPQSVNLGELSIVMNIVRLANILFELTHLTSSRMKRENFE